MLTASSIPELMLLAARQAAPSQPALLADGACLTYAEFSRRMSCIAGALMTDGLARGERVGLLAGRTADAVCGLFGIMAAGGAACVLDASARAAELTRRCDSAGITRLLVDAAHDALARKININKINKLQLSLAANPDHLGDLAATDDALLLFTSGSSGAPKAVLLTHGNLLANTCGIIERTGITPADRLLHAMPLHHTNGINNQLVAPLACGAAVVLLEHFRAETFFDAMAQYQPTYITGVPTMYSRLLQHAPPRAALQRLRFARCGSAPLTEALHREVEARLGVPLVVSYGLSEATCTSTMNPPSARRIGSVGTVLAGQRVAILQPRSEQVLTCGTEGEICIAGPGVMKGYVQAAVGDDGPQLQNGWLRTGDLGSLDADGYLSVSGRLKDIIIRGGENLSPAVIEAALLAHPAVKFCCVVGAPHPDLGEAPAAFVVLHAGHPAAGAELKTWVAERLSRSHAPQRITFLTTLPESGTGKIDRRSLRLQAVDNQGFAQPGTAIGGNRP